MFTICIPVYNKDVTRLVKTLQEQIAETKASINVVLIDDKSDLEFEERNKRITSDVQYVALNENIGRSRIRNKFLEYTDKSYLLFLDCDSRIVREDFVRSYLDFLGDNEAEVVFGASVYSDKRPARRYRLRWKYGRIRESRSYDDRIADSSCSFKTNNFMISRRCFANNPFNEGIKGYGHEDTLFGHELRKNKITIEHLDNPVLNETLDTNEEFVLKTEEGLHNLLKVLNITGQEGTLIAEIKLLRYYQRYRSSRWFSLFYLLARKPLRFLLINGMNSLFLFDVYKLGYLINIERKSAS